MHDEIQRRVDRIRRNRSELENHVIDEFFSGHISRREFVRAGSVVGLSLPLLSFIAACGGNAPSGGTSSNSSSTSVKKGGKITVGLITPAHAVDPFKVGDEGGLVVLFQMGEYLAFSDANLKLQPRLAESWSANSDGSVWTFKIRQNVTFNDGTPMTADDVAATVNMHADPANGSNALSVFKGVLTKGGAKATDASTVQFTLDAPNGNFPYLVSSDNYNLIILPKTYNGNFEKGDKAFIGTGPWKVTSFQTGQGMSTVRNPSYWDKANTPALDAVDWKFIAEEQPRVLALQGNSVQVVNHFSASGGQALFTDQNVNVIDVKAAAHRQVHMRTDMEPFTDKRVRQAVALSLSRPDLVQGLLNGKAQIANDSPFFKLYPSTDTAVAQRTQNLDKAKQLLAAAGKTNFAVTLSTWKDYEIPDYAQLIQSSVKKIGGTITLNITDSSTYYGDAVFGKSPWLDSVMGITDYGHRGVPNVYLGAPLVSTGTWNSAHFKNPQYDDLVRQYVAAVDLQTQKKLAAQIENLLLDETPIIFAYNYDTLGGVRSNIANVEITGYGQLDLRKTGIKA
ncbi:MAG: ABC transporter substrate-binding protein [Candidatus Dormibacteraeota bacterium]|nr:ABC transporter substrate-binding protein [Candidatus Dormibacteraeota bacterium]MDQ6920124.1 ABC transporter substrate-binding protein [Candidatus Dormibacteraeota bacterium]